MPLNRGIRPPTDHTVALVLPTHQLIDRLLASADLGATALPLAVFRPVRMFDTRAQYLAQHEAARDARVMLCTAASVVIDQRLGGDYNGATGRSVIVFDEADQLPDMTALQSDCVIDAALLQGQPLALALARISSLRSHGVEAEQKAAARVMLEILAEPTGYASVGLDARADQLSSFVPERFAANWLGRKIFEEGARQELLLSKAERDPGLRKAALRHYGAKCQHPACEVDQAHLLDVHHLDPVSEGVRRTTLQDVAVLCANHHRQAHFDMKLN